MRNILKKLHIVPSQPEDAEASASSLPTRGSSISRHASAGPSPPSSSSSSSSTASLIARGEIREQKDGSGDFSSAASEVLLDRVRRASESSRLEEPDAEEEYQIQLALEMSAREDPEAVQIEAVKQISLGSCAPENTPAEVMAYRYWNYNALSYDDKILDGFYDLYGILVASSSVKMPSLVDLQGMPVSDSISWEAVLVNKAEDADLLKLEQKALMMTLESRSESSNFAASVLVQRLAILVANYMGGIFYDPESMLKSYQNLSNYLRASSGNMVLPLGRLTIGLARHRALLFKVLADSLGIPCRLVKGKQYTGSDDGALDIVKFNDGREYIIDLMGEPGTLIPSDGAGLTHEFEDNFFFVNASVKDINSIHIGSSNSELSNSTRPYSQNEPLDKRSIYPNRETPYSGGVARSDLSNQDCQKLSSSPSSSNWYLNKNLNMLDVSGNFGTDSIAMTQEASGRVSHPYCIARSPSWTEGISSSTVHRKKVKDVSEYMINAAKENPQLAQKLHDVLLESGVVAPPNLFSEVCSEQSEAAMSEGLNLNEGKDEMKRQKCGFKHKAQADKGHGPFLPHLPSQDVQRKVALSRLPLDALKPVEGLGLHSPHDFQVASACNPCSSRSGDASAQLQETSLQFIKHMPVAAAAATAAVVASSVFVAAAKSNTDINLEVPVAAAATATAAAVVATTAAVNRQQEHLESYASEPAVSGGCHDIDSTDKNEDLGIGQVGSGHGDDCGLGKEQDAPETHPKMERSSEKSTGTESAKSDIAIDDVAEFEIPWEDIMLGERIGLGSFGEVYRGEWHGTEVAVKKFLNQEISSDALEEFRSEVRIMKRLRHPNVVLFMGAVTRVPNLSIVTEFLPRGSLFRLIHRPNNQLDERRRLRMALDVARGMNYLHNCTPVIVHRDLKSPNLLVDKNWVVKVCDFGLSRMKHNTFLSSRSTAGTAEWMAPEVLRNEPSNEKCDVFSFGVILWELCTLQQPWEGMNPMQVVGAVGFQHRCLDIPDDVDPVIADIIKKCWQKDPKMRPSFSEIMAALKPLQKPVSSSQVLKQRVLVADTKDKGEL
ncbi:probable serine/threonine-protein kinase SIS8 isoform X2 [Phoenix dactylifera]|uniref:non-specific serine/threonine protein kinase n=1 Tax=Phoenix dactylifera TaxID=42345 RepID=A0A8B8ZK10_PHODC|nr:probable serine/threonine-protein kinase SIS8 isoform X2 [Phoenix dactylifera]